MSNIKLFENKKVRSVWNEEKKRWFFAISDVVEALTDSNDVRQYIKKLRSRDSMLNSNWGTICTPLDLIAADGKLRKVLCADAEGILRIIQSIPSPKAESFKRWLAKVGYERLEEIENPELAAARMREIYKAKGYSDQWIEKRMRGIAVRDELTNEWKQRGIKEQMEYAILTADISKATFGMTPSEYKGLKELDGPDNLRDHMNDLELIFTMLGEASTTEIARNRDAKGLKENRKAAKQGGNIAGNARKELEMKSGKKVSTKTNYKELPESEERKKAITDESEAKE
ncbi:MAG TPA: Bro-N domain-containing protein [bacterium]|nr:Bro-N domain-containing protein [bacterium]